MKSCIIWILIMITAVAAPFHATAQEPLPYRDSSLSVDQRVQDLLDRMTPEEKFLQLFMVPGDLEIGKDKLDKGLFGLQVTSTGSGNGADGQKLDYKPFVPAQKLAIKINEIQKFFRTQSRLGIPVIPFEEALHGLIAGGATSFPQAIGLAATFDTSMMHQVSNAIASEARSRGIRQVLSPVLNIARDVRWGRTEETYGEDPYLVSSMGFAFISEFERAGIIATLKHFAVNSGEGGRDSYPVNYSDRLMEELYFPAFKTSVQQAGGRSVMTAYNSFDGSPCSSNNWLLNKKLKQEWGFRGFVISDACAVGGANVLHYTASGYAEAGQQAIENGLDVIFQTDYKHALLFSPPFLDGSVRQGAIDSAVCRVLRAKFELGLFEHPYVDSLNKELLLSPDQHRMVSLRAARESMVLLKNEDAILPISRDIKSVAIIGTDAVEARQGGYSGPGNNKISILEGMQINAPDGMKISYSPGCGRYDYKYITIPSENLCFYKDGTRIKGLEAEYFDNITLEGKPAITRTDPCVDFGWTLYGPGPSIPNDWYAVRWTGKVVTDSTGRYSIGIAGNDGYRLWLDGKLLIDNWVKKSYDTKLVDFSFTGGKEYDLRLEYFESSGNGRIDLVWHERDPDTLQRAIEKAVEVAGASDIAIVVAGIEEGEFRDRSSLRLPGRQEELINAVAATGKPIVVVIIGGSAVTMGNWINHVKAIVDAWYPGEAGGKAVAEVLLGKYNPGGRLPVTFPLSEGQLPLVYNHKPTGRGDDYNDLSGMPLFPFGYGLSYTTFRYDNMRFDRDTIKSGDSAIVKFTIQNSGSMAGDEVCQLYIRDELATVSRPVNELKGFRRIHLQPGELKQVEFVITPGDLAMFNQNMRRIVEPGIFRITIGSSSKDIRLRRKLIVGTGD